VLGDDEERSFAERTATTLQTEDHGLTGDRKR